LSIIKHVTLQKIVAHDFQYDPCITYCVCVFLALVFQHAKCMRHIVICIFPPLQSFPLYLISGNIFGGGGGGGALNITVFWFFLQLLSETFLILRRI
jgi:hypothetical protein